MSYDVFLSHSHVDKDWTRGLYDFLATANYNGRALRAWLDARALDPGNLSSARELESALDRSRRLVIVLAEESLASDWVQHEIRYFLDIRKADDVILIRRLPCTVPDQLVDCAMIEWPESAEGGEQREQLLRLLRPEESNMDVFNRSRAVRRAFGKAQVQQPVGFDPSPTEANRDLLKLLLSYEITDLDEEGLALVGFDSVGQFVTEMDAAESYAMRMVLGEFLAIVMLRNPAYGQVARSYIRKEKQSETQPSLLTVRNRALQGKTGPPSTTNLLFALARSGSKLAAIDPSRVDLSTIAAVLHRLDRRPALGTQERLVAMMTARALGKLHGTPIVDALLYALVEWGGEASHVAAAGAISTAFDDKDPDVFYTDELKRLACDAKAQPVRPPSSRIARLLFEPYTGLGLKLDVEKDVRLSRDDYTRAFGDWQPDGNWPELVYAPPATSLENGPLVGRLRRITLANMESLAERLGPTDIACLTELRIVDALLEDAGGFLIDDQQSDAPLGKRLRNRGVRFATFRHDILERFEDGSVLVLWPFHKGSSPSGFAVGGQGQDEAPPV